MARIVWTREAIQCLETIRIYIQQFDPEASRRFAERLVEAGESLSVYPERGRRASHGMRELSIVPPYILRYRLDGDAVQILSIRHVRQHSD